MKKRSFKKEVGDYQFPLEADLKRDILRKHKLIGQRVQVSPHALEEMEPLRGAVGKVTGIIVKNDQVAGLEVNIKGKTYFGPKKDWFIRRKLVEDIHLESPLCRKVKEVMAHWSQAHDFYGPSWSGIEEFCFELAKVTTKIAIESRGWYRYDSSTEAGMDGKDWRYIIPDTHGQSVVVNCHSLLHDHVWTLNTTVFSTRSIDPGKVRGEPVIYEHWQRTLLWARRTAMVLATDGYKYEGPIREMENRQLASQVLHRMKDRLLPDIVRAVTRVKGRMPFLPDLSMGFSPVRLKPGTVGRHEKPSDTVPYSIITIDPGAAAKPEYLFEVVKHELIHYALNQSTHVDPHNGDFKAVAKMVGLPLKYQD